MNRDERSEKIEEYGRGFDLLTAALAEIPREAWEAKPTPQEWSVHELIIHMKDSEYMGVMRLHKLIAEPGSILTMPYDAAKWSAALNYQNQSIDDALQLFKLTRQVTYQMLKTLPDRVFAQTVVVHVVTYPEYGESYTPDKWLHIYTRHVRDHIEQMKSNHRAWTDRKK